jgi:polyhydroxyalkanoate synthesis regulator protein
MAQAAQPILIKQYAGARLYDIEAGRYVTLETIADLVRDRHTVIVQNAKTGADITSITLARISAGTA